MKLTKNSVSIVENIVDFTCALVFKDEIKAFEMETQESAVKASEYLSAYLKTDSLSDSDRKRIIDNYKELNTYYKNLLDEYEIAPYISRLAKDLDIIYQPEKMILTHSYLYYYRTIYKQCLQSFYTTSYSSAMASKDNYREFCLLSINLMTFLQLLNRWLENPYDINLMTERQIDRFMISFGISFFTGLPFKYKQIVARNLNRLIINKGTDKVVIDILELFGFAEINISKYYLIRQAVTRQDTINGKHDYREVDTHDVYFLSHNINLPSLNYAIKHNLYTKHLYEQLTSSDDYWQISKDEVKKLDFDYVETKYFSIDTGFNLNAEVMNTTLIVNLLKRIRSEYETKEKLEVLSNIISETRPSKLEDIIITLQILMCEYQGLEDIIQYDLVGIAKTYEFAKYDPINVNINLMKDIPKIKDINDIELVDLRTITRFDEPEILKIHTQNSKVKKNLEELISNESNYQDYKKIRAAHNAKFYQKINYDIFNSHKTLTSYLKTRNEDLYNIVENIKGNQQPGEKVKTIQNMITSLTDIIASTLQNFSIFLGATSLDILVSYMRTTILAFKSFTTSLLDLNVFIIMKESYETRVMDHLERISSTVQHKVTLKQLEDNVNIQTLQSHNSRNMLTELATNFEGNIQVIENSQPVLFDNTENLSTIYFENRCNFKYSDNKRIQSAIITDSKVRLNDKLKLRKGLIYNSRFRQLTDSYHAFSNFTYMASHELLDKVSFDSVFIEKINLSNTDKLHFHKNSVINEYSNLLTIKENVVITPSAQHYIDTLLFTDNEKFKSHVETHSRVRLNDNYFITQVTYT